MEIPKLIPTNPEQGSDQPYYIYDPEVFNDTDQYVSPDALARELTDTFEQVADKGPFFIEAQGNTDIPVAALLDKNARDVEAPELVRALMSDMANRAVQMGFDKDKTVASSYIHIPSDNNPETIIHSDGMEPDDREVESGRMKRVRFVYSPKLGTILYPSLPVDRLDTDTLVGSPSAGYQVVPRADEGPLHSQTAVGVYEPSDEELDESSAQQVMPGKVLVFDSTRTFWHQAPDAPRPVMVVDFMEI